MRKFLSTNILLYPVANSSSTASSTHSYLIKFTSIREWLWPTTSPEPAKHAATYSQEHNSCARRLKAKLSISYTSTSQFPHLILNTDLGLPSDLWVLSTELISPQTGNQYSIDSQHSLMKGVTFNLSLFYRTMKNILEYRQPIDLFTGIINGIDLMPIFNLQNDRVSELFARSGRGSGIEVAL